ncbi:Decaprenyl diphosphate synthase-like protein [Scenedesmus sp. NREL 46B-D3]|nr:Decaprenyl diphosphate synthase-like protein [Scenedesmus sp. NREL 46B-D3]
MDGNSRWAEARGLPAWVGHERGVAALRAAVLAAQEWGIPALTVYAFSLDNWQRDKAEVTFLMDLFRSALRQQLPELQRNGVRLQFMGQVELLPPALQQQMADCTAATAGNSQLLLNVAVSYSAQHDMTAAVQRLAQRVQEGSLTPEQQLASAAVTAAVGPPDLLIRTSGEQRLSNFMLFEAAYTELCFLDCMWPDFDKQQFDAALQQYAQRQRRFGRRQNK